ncbi:MAG: ATP-dependent Clp protease proteolytic subunit, partial [Alphaproteobacteria bacterium]
KHTGKKINQIEEALERDRFMNPQEAKSFGLIDQIVEKQPFGGEEKKAA